MCLKKTIAIIDYGMGNIQSIINALNFLKIPNAVINKPQELSLYNKVILPGVGSYKHAMKKLKQSLFSDTLINLIKKKKNICFRHMFGYAIVL